jgi:hypothetical protein
MQQRLRAISIVVLLAIIGYALTITGSPTQTRMVNEDIETLEELEQLHGALTASLYRNGKIVESLDANMLNTMESGSYGDNHCGKYYSNKRYEAERLNRYEYSTKPSGYTICTNFNTNWVDIKMNKRFYENRFNWAENIHQGRNCFERTIPECKRRNQP